jgi:hypothetical protein
VQQPCELFGPAADWWDTYVEAHEKPESINWPEFRAAFMHIMFPKELSS